MNITKLAILILMLLIIYSLISALVHMIKNKDNPQKMAKALSWRIGLSATLFIFLIIAAAAGWITPHELGG